MSRPDPGGLFTKRLKRSMRQHRRAGEKLFVDYSGRSIGLRGGGRAQMRITCCMIGPTTWYGSHARSGWASCPITENGSVRVMSHPGYPNALPVRAVVERLVEPRAGGFHEFWPDRIRLLDGKVADSARIHGPRQITDVYLRALTVPHGDRFVTSDTAVSRDAVVGVERCRVVVL